MSAGKLLPPYDIGVNKRVIAVMSVAGPTSYTTGGFSVIFDDISDLSNFAVRVTTNPSQLLEEDNTVYSVSYTVDGNSVNIVIKTLDVTAAAPVSWTEISAGTDLSSVTFVIEVFEL